MATNPKPSGLKTPSKIAKPSGLPHPKSGIPPPAAKRQSPDPQMSPTPPVDDFIIGDRVWVSGNKPGVIAFLGETSFAPGEWAGVILDEMLGKNDGSVSGVRYFQCEPKFGVFARISKLSRTPQTPKPEAAGSSIATSANGTPIGGLAVGNRSMTPKSGLAGSRGSSASTSSLNKISPTTSSMTLSKDGLSPKYMLKTGDRVLVSGTKPGTLRYIGATDFAKGDWAGVELDDKLGKNDGAVAGKRYFECKPQYGLFAPVHKVTRLVGGVSTPSPRTLGSTSLRMSRERSGSQESVSSISSTASSVSRSRVRLGVTALSSQHKQGQRPGTLNISATTSALQKALKEKEEHIEQLLRERELERSEVARAAAKVDQAEGDLAVMRSEHDRFKDSADDALVKWKNVAQQLERKNHELENELEDLRRKTEDLQFQIEEEVVGKDDLESKTEEEEAKLQELESKNKKMVEKSQTMEKELTEAKGKLDDYESQLKVSEDTQTMYLDQIDELTHKLTQAENKITSYEATKLEEGAKTSPLTPAEPETTSQVSVELAEKTAKVSQLEEALYYQTKEMKQVQEKLAEVLEELKESEAKKQKMQETINELTSKLDKSTTASESINSEMKILRGSVSDIARQLESSRERAEQLSDDKDKLEQQIAELMRNSGDSSQQLSLLNEQLRDKDRKVEELLADLSNSTQRTGKLNETIEQLKEQRDKDRETLTNQQKGLETRFQTELEEKNSELEKLQSKLTKQSEEFGKEMEELIVKKDGELGETRRTAEEKSGLLEEVRSQHQEQKNELEEVKSEKETLLFEKDRLEKQVRRLETEKEAATDEVTSLQAEVSRMRSESEAVKSEGVGVNDQLLSALKEVEKGRAEREEMLKLNNELKSEKNRLQQEQGQTQVSVTEMKAKLQQLDITVEQKTKEIEKLQGKLATSEKTLSQSLHNEETSNSLTEKLNEANSEIVKLKQTVEESESKKQKIQEDLTASKEQLLNHQKLADEKFEKKLQDIHKHAQLKEIESEKKALVDQVESRSGALQERDSKLTSQSNQMKQLQKENSRLKENSSSLTESLSKENKELLEKVKALEEQLAQKNAPAGHLLANGDADTSEDDSAVSQLKKENEESVMEIELLKSEIVYLHMQNENLKSRLDALVNGDVKDDEAHNDKRKDPLVTLRLFCDICEEFDKHDTEDCPQQTMSDSPPCTQYHGTPKQERAYCEICEEIGTEIGECCHGPMMMMNAEEDGYADPNKNNGDDAGVPSEGDEKGERAHGGDGDVAESQKRGEGACVEEKIELAEMATEMSELKYCMTEGEDALLSIDNAEGDPEQQMDEDSIVMDAVEIGDAPSSLTPDTAPSPGVPAATPPPSTPPTTTAATPAPNPAPVPPATGKAESPSIAEKVDHCIIC
ncbi:CAP-Gly domain-containing linker protein 1 isoform X2 [Octopus sinensis]|uniref:CAP-Gly domain-containing linker protein 1 isoform X2 n=1 Tax=Octopus sinensis TaxID=2607531 RepID=A0A7E6FT29_9MOLL|nr:CAP-Gly domain-containing linker protein 1 isoform X2 [Octopus sinensis]